MQYLNQHRQCHNTSITRKDIVKPAHTVTSIMQSPVLKGPFVMSCHRRFHMNWNSFKRRSLDHFFFVPGLNVNWIQWKKTVFSVSQMYFIKVKYQGWSWLENKTEINEKIAETIYTPLSKWSFLICSDHVQQLSKNFFLEEYSWNQISLFGGGGYSN